MTFFFFAYANVFLHSTNQMVQRRVDREHRGEGGSGGGLGGLKPSTSFAFCLCQTGGSIVVQLCEGGKHRLF